MSLGWQAKVFTGDEAQWKQVDESVRRALDRHRRLVRMTICFPRDREDPRTAGRSSVMDAWKRFSFDAATERRLAQDFTSEDKHSTGRRRKHPRSRHGGRTATRTGSPSTPSNQETHPSRRPTSVRHTDPRITTATRLVGQVPCAPLGSDIGCEVTPHLKSKDFQSALRMLRLS
jgi:hypothetical protein